MISPGKRNIAWLAAFAVGSAVLGAGALSAEEEKVQKINFIEDDAQTYFYTKIYNLKHAKAVDLAPFVKTAVKRCRAASTVQAVSDPAGKREMLIVTTKSNMLECVDEMIKALDRPGKANAYGSIIEGTGIAYGTYSPKFRGNETMREIIVDANVSNGVENSTVEYDSISGMFYFKDTPFRVEEIKRKLSWLDREIPQVMLEFNIYEVRDSDLRDIGLDYLAWKNGPGLNLLEAGYQALSMKAAELLIQEGLEHGLDLFGNFGAGFGGFYTAPAFDLSFVRLLQQNGKATINSKAAVMVSNVEDKVFSVSFAPEYQNIFKDEDHRSSVDVGGASDLTAEISSVVVTGNKTVNFTCGFNASNVVERNNLGAEISESTVINTSAALNFQTERVIAKWDRATEVEQTIGIPFLCELPILKYIFGTTTTNIEKTHYIVTARAVPVKYNSDIKPGISARFNDLVKK